MSAGMPLLAGVMGWPVGHSLSPQLHGCWIAEHGLKAHYVPLPVAPDSLATALQALPALGFRGVNLTIPHKETALAVVKDIDRAAAMIGAINTVVVEDGKLLGRNTDAIGYSESLREAGVETISGHAIVLGAGGAARAILFALYRMGVRQVVLANRTRERAEALKKDAAKLNGLEIAVANWAEVMRHGKGAGLLVNTTALGMAGQNALEIDLTNLNSSAVVSDIVYRPLRTPLLLAAEARGHRAVEGLGMLLHQAVPAFEAWFGVRPKVTPELWRKLKSALGEA
jgi:shikimate dehydrogenase